MEGKTLPPCGNVFLFEGTLNCVTCERERALLIEVILESFCSVDHSELREILWRFSNRKVLGIDGLPSGAFKNAPPSLVFWLSSSVPGSVINTYTLSCLAVQIVALLRSKVKNPVLLSNYGPIAILTAWSKLMEMLVLMLHCLEASLNTLDNQFSYIKGHSSKICVRTLKNIIE